MKLCLRCQHKKVFNEFGIDRQKTDGLRPYCSECERTYWNNNKERKNKQRRERYLIDKKVICARNYAYTKFRRTYDLQFRLRCNLSRRINNALHGNIKSERTKELLGCSIEELKRYIENKFIQGMTWKNYGLWHIDHIQPCISFDLSIPDKQRECFNYSNLQPLWAKDNIIKRNKYESRCSNGS